MQWDTAEKILKQSCISTFEKLYKHTFRRRQAFFIEITIV